MSARDREPCTCTATHQPCEACLVWRERRPGRRGRRRTAVVSPAELRLRGLAHHYEPGAASALFVPLAPLEVTWL